MLVTSRCRGESNIIGDDLMVTVVNVRGGHAQVRAVRRVRGGRITAFEELANVWLGRGESIPLGEGISCAIVDIRAEKVRLGIVAAKEVSVHRREVYDALVRAARRSGHGGGREWPEAE